jgi:hypothetical protein
MTRIIIRGSAAVRRGDDPVADPAALRSLAGVAYADERFTDYVWGRPGVGALAADLEPGGAITFGYRDGEDVLTATTEYRSRRPLTAAEVRLLVDYTLEQWSDGIGENWAGTSAERCGYTILCLTAVHGVGPDYPEVEIVGPTGPGAPPDRGPAS